jgi:hypothetical protein
MRRKIAALVLACGALLTFVAPAFPFSVVHPVTGECRQVLVPGPDTSRVTGRSSAPHQLQVLVPGTGMGTRTAILRSDP